MASSVFRVCAVSKTFGCLYVSILPRTTTLSIFISWCKPEPPRHGRSQATTLLTDSCLLLDCVSSRRITIGDAIWRIIRGLLSHRLPRTIETTRADSGCRRQQKRGLTTTLTCAPLSASSETSVRSQTCRESPQGAPQHRALSSIRYADLNSRPPSLCLLCISLSVRRLAHDFSAVFHIVLAFYRFLACPRRVAGDLVLGTKFRHYPAVFLSQPIQRTGLFLV